jgi:endonuclease III
LKNPFIQKIKSQYKIIPEDVDKELYVKALTASILSGKTTERWVNEAITEFLNQGPMKMINMAIRQKLEQGGKG